MRLFLNIYSTKYFPLLLIFTQMACKGTEATYNREPIVPANAARIVGKIVKIEAANPDAPQPCQSAPCIAQVRIVKLLSKGDVFRGNFKVSEKVTIRFAYTLLPTADLIDSLENHLQGLQEGDRFEAEVVYTLAESATTSYVIHEYRKL
ncbi:MAG: hypothetical protein ACFB0B_18995 [Thermonemataceae bacterium]